MREVELIYYVAQSRDGFIAGPNGERPAWVPKRQAAFDRSGLRDVARVGASMPPDVLNAAASMKLRRLWLVGSGPAARFAGHGLTQQRYRARR